MSLTLMVIADILSAFIPLFSRRLPFQQEPYCSAIVFDGGSSPAVATGRLKAEGKRAAIDLNAAPHLKPVFKRRERAPETKDFDDHSIHQRGNVQRGESRPAAREHQAVWKDAQHHRQMRRKP